LPESYLIGFHCHFGSDDTVIFGCCIDRMHQRSTIVCIMIFIVSACVANEMYGRKVVQCGTIICCYEPAKYLSGWKAADDGE
jgi:hypothetical protein